MRKNNLIRIRWNPISLQYWRKSNSTLVLQHLLVLGVILFSVIFPWLVPQRFQLFFLASLLVLLGALILLENQSLGLVAILLISFFVPFNGPGGLNGALIAVVLVSCIWFVNILIRHSKIRIVPTRINLSLIVFVTITTLSFGLGQLSWYDFTRQAPINAQFGGFLVFFLSVIAFLLVANLIKDLRWLQVLTWLFVGFGSLYVLDRFVPGVTQALHPLYRSGIISQSIFWVWLVVIPLSQILFNPNLRAIWRVILFGILFATLYTAIVHGSSWKSGYIPPLAGATVIIGFRFRRQAWLFVPLGLIIAWYISVEAIATDQYSYSTRLDAWQIVLEIAKASPLFGMGFANYYWYTPLIPIGGWYINFNAHSQYVDIVAQTGFLGLLCFSWIFWEVGRLGWMLRDQVPEGFARGYVYGALGGLAGTLVAGIFADWILPFVYNIGLEGFRSSVLGWMFLGGLVSLKQMVRYQNQT
jgi:O-antigen ligase